MLQVHLETSSLVYGKRKWSVRKVNALQASFELY